MYQIFLTDQLKTQNTTPAYSGTNDLTVVSGKIYLKGVSRMNIKTGMYFIVSGVRYSIDKFSYSDINLTYTFTVTPLALSGTFLAQTWQIFDFSSTDNYVELDCEDVDIETVYQVADISDISSRKDTITKTITLKGTQNNNIAFGNLFFLNRHVDLNISNKLAFNYSPLRQVNCLIYEDSMLILRGTMLVTEVDVDKLGNIQYQTTVTGTVISLKAKLGDSLLSDLELIDLKHQYQILNIVDTWGGLTDVSNPNSIGNSRTAHYDPVTNTYFTEPFEYGKNYVYSWCDYGVKFLNDANNQSYYYQPLTNYRPAIYVREYINRIFDQNNYTYEIKASPEFIDQFNHLIIPNNEAELTTIGKGVFGKYHKTIFQENAYNNQDFDNYTSYPVQLDITDVEDLMGVYPFPYPIVSTTIDEANRHKNIFYFKSTLNTTGRVRITGTFISATSNNTDTAITIQLGRRVMTIDDAQDFDSIGDYTIQGTHLVTKNFDISFDIPATDFVKGDQIQLRVLRYKLADTSEHNDSYIGISAASIQFSIDDDTVYTKNVEPNDYLVPRPPDGVSQFDFVKSILSLFNMYLYTNNDLPNHYILQQYDSYYAYTSPALVKSTALDWTRKVDLAQSLKIKSNITIPKSYKFTFKDDGDFNNKTYKDANNESYGTLSFNDSLGISDSKSVSLIFSPTPTASIWGVNRMQPMITDGGISLSTKKTFKSNIRILYYSGVYATTDMRLCVESVVSGIGYGIDMQLGTNWYALASNYLFSSDTDIHNAPYGDDGNPATLMPVRDIHFATPKQFYFVPTQDYYTLPNSYNTYYINQITELTNENLFTMECEVYLNEFDISSLDLSIPVFIDTGEYGYSYFKVLTVNYKGNYTTSTVKLQKIV